MSADLEPRDWTSLDPWWAAYAQSQPLTENAGQARVFDLTWLAECHEEIDEWWEVYTEGDETAKELKTLLARSDDEWAQSEAPFNTDPLSVDLTDERFRRGPLQPSNELGWSNWLARLLNPSGDFVSELFDSEMSEPPNEVLREERVPDTDGGHWRPDILLLGAENGISIEVKLDDTNYEKTSDTAARVEEEYQDRAWTHVLLLPKNKRGRLESIVEPPVERSSDGLPRVHWERPGTVRVMYWRDVTAALRSLLLRGAIVDDHWAANAYLFCTVAEQQRVGFQPRPVVDRLANPGDVVDAIQPIRIADILEEQLTYLRETVEA
ncbi:hypothetical protein [Haloglomus litoreum]|uniref:hypothetical protein n=1 Tax=Haloglomus litoreum TaxID=3034026 RepID=UPI0023E8DA19|nr:hypothetical protein [Haloglomus sp. DT116]